MRDTQFVATETGIAPFRSMLRWLLADASRYQNHELWLLFGTCTTDAVARLLEGHEQAPRLFRK